MLLRIFTLWPSDSAALFAGSIVSDYGLDDRAIWVQSPAGAKEFSSILFVQTGSGAHSASCPMGTRGPFLGGKVRPGRDSDHWPPSSAEVVNEYELYLLSPQAPPWRVPVLLYFILRVPQQSVTAVYQRLVGSRRKPLWNRTLRKIFWL
jgi:hypothetical protein